MKKFYKNRDKIADEEIRKMKESYESGKIDEDYIRKLVAEQKGELSVNSMYWTKEKISEGNWSKIEDLKIKTLDEEEICIKPAHDKPVDVLDVILGLDESYLKEKKEETLRAHSAEYEYVFVPSFYAVITLILYYINDKKEALKVYNLKNAVVRKEIKRDKEIYSGGLPFILKYLERFAKDDYITAAKTSFADIMERLIERKKDLEINKEKDEFINDIISCIEKSKCRGLILEKRIRDCDYAKDKYIEYKEIDGYRILKHRDVEKDWKHLKEGQIKKANEIINNTPKFPKNEPPKNDPLNANIKGWFSQRVSKKDRVVYKKDYTEKAIYIATVCDHYKNAEMRSKSKESYR